MKNKIKIGFNSPVIITFTAICLIATILGAITNSYTDTLFFSVYKSSLTNPLTYIRFVGHIFGHADFEHFLGNITLLLLLGPLLEEKYGSKKLILIIFGTAIITGLIQFMFFNSALLGASGVVFAFILLSSITSVKGNAIPLTFILVAILYIGNELYSAIFIYDNVSQITHIVGGICGASFGFLLAKKSGKSAIS